MCKQHRKLVIWFSPENPSPVFHFLSHSHLIRICILLDLILSSSSLRILTIVSYGSGPGSHFRCPCFSCWHFGLKGPYDGRSWGTASLRTSSGTLHSGTVTLTKLPLTASSSLSHMPTLQARVREARSRKQSLFSHIAAHVLYASDTWVFLMLNLLAQSYWASIEDRVFSKYLHYMIKLFIRYHLRCM